MNEVIKFLIDFSSKEKVISGREIAKRFDIDRIEVRHLINKARCEGIPICSNTSGYYYSTDVDEVRKTVDSLVGRISSMSKAITGLRSFRERAEYYDDLL
jgi:biotin operon repressor